MIQRRHLLAATDLSAPARHAVERAALVAKETGADLDLLHVASLAPLEKMRRLVAEIPVQLEQRVLDTARGELHELAMALQEKYQVPIAVEVTFGELIPEIDSRAVAKHVDLIVFGAHGASFVRHLLLGSTAERMIGKATRPMLVVKQAAHERYRTLLVPVDFSAASLIAIHTALAVAPQAEIILLHVFEIPFEGKLQFAGIEEDVMQHYRAAAQEEALQRLQWLSDQAGLSPQTCQLVVLHGDPSMRIIEQEQEQDCDLIVMGRCGERAIEEILLGSVTRQVLAESQCDVLVSV